MTVTIREVTDPNDPSIDEFGRMQTEAYFAPETLIPARYIPLLLGDETGTRRNFLLVAELDHHVVGGALFHWLATAGSGFSSFMGVAREHRREGIARQLHNERVRLLERVSRGRVAGVFIDVVNPSRMSAEELERERRAGSDPWGRRLAFEKLGFKQVDIRYEQPVGGPNGGPVTILDLLYCPREAADRVATSLVVATMRAYWSPWLGEAAEHHARVLEERAQGAEWLALVSPVPPRRVDDR
jgi:hypothetical protein